MRNYRYTIFQMSQNEQTHGLKFFNLDNYQKEKGEKRIDMGLYNHIYNGTVEAQNMGQALNILWDKFNTDHPEDFRGHSLSVSDLVSLVPQTSKGRSHYFFCDSFSWEEVKLKGVARVA